MSGFQDLWSSEHARYDVGVFRAREELERLWPKNTPLRIADVKGYFGDFLVTVEAEPTPDHSWRTILRLAGGMVRHEPGKVVSMAFRHAAHTYANDPEVQALPEVRSS